MQRVVEIALRVETIELVGLQNPLIGMVMHRGSAVPVLSLRQRLGLPLRPGKLSDHFVIVRTVQGVVALEADRVEDVAPIDLGNLVAPPSSAETTLGLAWTEDGFIVVTDPDAVFAHEHRKNFESALERVRAAP